MVWAYSQASALRHPLVPVRHHNAGMHLPAKLLGRFTERPNKCLPRILARKHVMTVVSPVDEVIPRTGKLNANSSCHNLDATFAPSRTPILNLPEIGVL